LANTARLSEVLDKACKAGFQKVATRSQNSKTKQLLRVSKAQQDTLSQQYWLLSRQAVLYRGKTTRQKKIADLAQEILWFNGPKQR
jgi:hypothetical protein